MQYDTAGNPMVFYDMCACCDLDTGGNHQHWCACYQPPIQKESYAKFGAKLKVEIGNQLSGVANYYRCKSLVLL